MKINRLFSIAAATMMMVACSSEDTALNNNRAAGPQMQFTATIAAPGSGATRTEYTESGTDINVAWKVGDEIALIHGNVRDVATVKTINADGSATINGYVTGATDEADVQLYYPAARMISNGQGGFTFDPVIEGKKLTQDGTLKYIQDNLDFREGEGKLSVNGTEVTLKEPVKMAAENAIWKLALKDDAETPAALAASQLAIMIGSDTIASTAILSTAASTVYLAVPGMADKAITIGATVDEDTYAYKKEGVTLASGKYYQSTVNMSMVKTIDLSELQGDCEAKNGYTLTGTLGANVKISIAAGATVTLDGVTINGVDNESYKWAGITCDGDAIIILKGTNTVKGFYNRYPGIHPAVDHKLTIKGTGSLTASSNAYGGGAGIGGGMSINCGNIEIQGGVITAIGGGDGAGIGSGYKAGCGSITISGGTVNATGGEGGAGIGSGHSGSCGDITISGGTVTANGGNWGAGIGSGYGNSAKCDDITISGGTVTATGGEKGAGIGSARNAKCDNITITTGVTQVTATKGNEAPNSIGAGNGGTCGTVTIGGVTTGNITISPYKYPLPALSLTNPAVGQVIGSDGKNYEYGSVPSGVKAVAKICYSNGTKYWALALKDDADGAMKWVDANQIAVAHQPAFSNGTWRLPTSTEWQAMRGSKSNYASLRDGFASVGGTNMASANYWGASYDNNNATFINLNDTGITGQAPKNNDNYKFRVRAVLVF